MTDRVSVIIPTLNAGRMGIELVEALRRQTLVPHEILVIDSGSTDGTAAALSRAGATVRTIASADFHHGTVRNDAALRASGNILVFMTQDAAPQDGHLLERLADALRRGAAAAYARHVPRQSASPLEKYARLTNYPAEGSTERNSTANAGPRSIRSVFFSNTCSAVLRDVFERLGGFPTHTIMNEDMLFAARLRRAGYRIEYVPEARVLHSHDYSLIQTFKRYFDIGVVFAQAREELAGLDATGEGIRYVRGLFTTLLRDRQYAWMAAAAAESAAKWVGIFLGKRYKSLPLPIVKRLSMHRRYWDRAT